MVAHEGVSSKVYKNVSLRVLKYFETAYLEGVSIITVLRNKDAEFGTMLKIFEGGGTSYVHHLGRIIRPLEEAGLLSCNYTEDRCNVTAKGIRTFEIFENEVNTLDEILRRISIIGMKAFNEENVIQESMKHLREYKILYRPFMPDEYTNPFVKAFAEAEGNLYNFILKIISLPHPLAFLLIASHIKNYETRYETHVLTCKSKYGYLIGKETKEILEALSNENKYPTGEGIKEILRDYMKEYNIPWFKSPIQTFVASRLIEKVRNEVFCTCGITRRYKDGDNRYKLTEHGKKLSTYMALHILLSYTLS
jgi:predicted transcriptional regulator